VVVAIAKRWRRCCESLLRSIVEVGKVGEDGEGKGLGMERKLCAIK
jgi:hypothetical protein